MLKKIHVNVTNVSFADNQIGPEGASNFVKYNKVATFVDLQHNPIQNKGAMALASAAMTSFIVDKKHSSFSIEINGIDSAGKMALAELCPLKRTNYGRQVALQSEVPSLQRLSLFKLKELAKDALNPADFLHEDLAKKYRQYKI